MLRVVSLSVLALALSLPAQGGAPTFVPREGAFAHIVVEDVPALLAQLPKTALGRLLADPEVDEAFGAYLARYRELVARQNAIQQCAAAMGIETGSRLETSFPRQIAVADLQRLELVGLAPTGESRRPRSVLLVGCTPRSEGRLTQAFEKLARAAALRKNMVAAPDSKIGGFPAHVFSATAEDEQSPPGYGPLGQWYVHLPGVFACGEGMPDECGTVGPAPARGPAGFSLKIDLQAYIGMLAGFGGGPVPGEVSAIGLDGLKLLEWRGTFAGERILDELEVTLADKPSGLIAALLTGKAPLPPQPLPPGALVQLRCAVDVDTALDAAVKLFGDAGPPDLGKDLAAALTGGLAIGAAAPAPGGVIPRVFVSLGIADQAALDRALAHAVIKDKLKKVTYAGVECFVLPAPYLPSGMQPTWCVVDGVLHVAESGASLRALLEARKDGVVAMDVGDAPLPEGAGDVLPTFELRCDEAAMYRAFRDVWLPLYALLPETSRAAMFVRRDEMPSPDTVAKHLGKSRGVLRRRGDAVVVQHTGTLGGPEAAALAMTWGPIVGAAFSRDWQTERLSIEVAKKKLEAVWPVLEAHKAKNGAWPATLGEVFVSGKLADDALLVAGDPMAEEIDVPGNPARKVKTSFRYFPQPVTTANGRGGATRLLLVAIEPRSYERPMLAEDGSLPNVWGVDNTRPVGEFGK